MANVKVFVALFAFVQLAFIVADAADLWWRRRKNESRARLLQSWPVVVLVLSAGLFYFAIQLAFAFLIPGTSLLLRVAGVTAGVREHSASAAGFLPLAVIFLFTYFVLTFFDYMVHRFLLHGMLWRLHENHHLPTVVSNLMPGIAARPFVAIPNLIINFASGVVVLFTLRVWGHPEFMGALIMVVPALLFWFAFVACASHSSFLRNFPWVDRCFRASLLITPREHELHHAARMKGNYGNFTPLWDRMFGTYLAPRECERPAMGLEYDQDFLGTLTAGRLKLPPRFRERLQVARVCRLDQ